MKTHWIFFLVSIHATINLSAQVLTSDSLALVDFYNATSGSNWKNKSHWLNGNVSNWYGILLEGNQVSIIDLPSNNLTGSLPNSFCNLSKLKYLRFANNHLSGNLPSCFGNMTNINTIDFTNSNLTGPIPPGIVNFAELADLFITGNSFDQLPDLSSLTEFGILEAAKNKLDFGDLIPNKFTLRFGYIPQDSVNKHVDTIVTINADATFQTYCKGTGNQYQWTKNNSPITDDLHYQGCTTPILKINKAELSDEANYSCTITNPDLPALTLTRSNIRISINDTRLVQTITVIPGPDYFCGDIPLKINASTNSTLLLNYTILKGEATMKLDSVQPSQPGNITVRIFNNGDDTYKPVQKDTIIKIFAPSNPTPVVTKLIPTEIGEKLELSIPYISGEDAFWINPAKDSTFNNIYKKNFVNESDEGTYIIKAGKNNCYYFSEKIPVQFSSLHNIIAYELITPNDDGKNDYFHVDNIEKYSDSEIQIFNASKQLVFHKTNYNNDWSGKELPEGTYYYLVKIPSENKLLKGSVYLKK